MKSLAARFREQGIKEQEVLTYISDWGYYYASLEYKCSLDAMWRYARRLTGDENFGTRPRFSGLGGTGNNDIFEVVRTKLESYVAKTEKHISEMDVEIQRLKVENELLRRNNYRLFGNKLLAIVEAVGG